MVYINEWLPNPVGRDTQGSCPNLDPICMTTVEWVELWNNGESVVSLAGWRLENGAGKKAVLGGSIAPNEYLLLPRAETKLTLRNSNETLSFYDGTGKLIDRSAMPILATEGKSFARVGDKFIVANPTPGEKNINAAAMQIANVSYSFNEALNPAHGAIEVVSLALLVGVVLASVAVYIVKQNVYLSELFFGQY